MKARTVRLAVGLVTVIILVGCGKAEPTAAPVAAVLGSDASDDPRGVLQGATALALGTLKLEGTEHAVTPGQADRLLPLWQVIQGGSLQGAAETEAVLTQIKGVLDEDQLALIDEMELTFQEIGTWMQSPFAKALGIEMPTRVAGQGGGGAFQTMSEDQRNRFRQEMQNMTPEQRATRLAEMGVQRPEGGGPGGGRQGGFAGRGGSGFLVEPLIDLLSERASE